MYLIDSYTVTSPDSFCHCGHKFMPHVCDVKYAVVIHHFFTVSRYILIYILRKLCLSLCFLFILVNWLRAAN